MKIGVLLLLLAGWNGLLAAAPPEVTVRCLGPRDEPATWKNAPLFVFDDQPVTFDVEVTAPRGSALELRADLFETSGGGWSLPISKGLVLCPALEFTERTELMASCGVPKLPPVRRLTHLVLKLSTQPAGSITAGRPAGILDVFVYPRAKPGDWKKLFAAMLAEAGMTRVAVFGKDRRIREFFRREKILFDDLGTEWPPSPAAQTLYLGDSPKTAPDPAQSPAGRRFGVFIANPPDSASDPGVYATADPAGGAMVKVTLPDALEALEENPRCQETFLQTVRLALSLREAPGEPISIP